MTLPLASVIIPVYNREHLIRPTLESVAAQMYKHLEVIIIDDGSTDASGAVAKQLLQTLHLPGEVYSIKNSGPDAARDYGIQQAHGDLFVPLDSDDLWLPEYLQTVVQVITEWTETALVFCDFYLLFDDERPPIKKSATLQHLHALPRQKLKDNVDRIDQVGFLYLLQEQPIFPSAVAIRRELYDHIGPFCKHISGRLLSAEWEFFLRSAHQKFPLIYIQTPLVKIRKHSGNLSKELVQQTAGEITVLKIVQKTYRLSQEEQQLVHDQIAYRSLVCGYQYFSGYQMSEARALLKNALISRYGRRAAYYLALSLLPVPLLRWLRRCKSST
ncbi:glycosyltransferase [candidate division KSB3 bacterium]|uniref:Glycosyltransferase n=1 Tax=candidate division KSB3 bacterium TaxID=2044937 RepID=A0A9D5Q8U6_9BACT|nr:glycosyltransferase [candidate division KSB3 bacterium]MBD3327211.1 glycosyltransferase [candidate division KSB3 bacterium]